MILRRLVVLALGLSTPCLIGLQSRAEAAANMKDQLIFHYCSKAMNADFSKAGKTPPQGMVQDTCDCVVQQINSRATIDQAKVICQANAQKKYSLE